MSNRRFVKRKAAKADLDPAAQMQERLRKQAAARLLKRRRRKSHQ